MNSILEELKCALEQMCYVIQRPVAECKIISIFENLSTENARLRSENEQLRNAENG